MQATNNFVWVIRDKTVSDKHGLIVPGDQKIKPNTGIVVYAGNTCKDSKIKNSKGKKAIFHPTVGFEIEYNEKTYLLLTDDQIIGIDD